MSTMLLTLRLPRRIPVALLLAFVFLAVLALAAAFPAWLAPGDPLLADPPHAM